jgi:hypothetical protein
MTKYDKQWDMQYEQLVEFKRHNGLCMVPLTDKQEKVMGYWVSRQRSIYKNNKMRVDRKNRLDEIGFAWTSWSKQYEKMVEFKRKHGHCMMPSSNCELGRWVSRQRNLYTKGAMLQHRKDLLDEQGFVWNCDEPRESKWNEQCERMVEFIKKTGRCVVPSGSKEDASLHTWDLVGKADAQGPRSSTMDVRGLDSSLDHFTPCGHVSHSLSFFLCFTFVEQFRFASVHQQCG